jgi:hypothetical protein
MLMYKCVAAITGHPLVVNTTLFGKIGDAMTKQGLFANRKTKSTVLAGMISWEFEATEDEVRQAKERFEKFGNSFQLKAMRAAGINFDFVATPIEVAAIQYLEVPNEVKQDGKTVQPTEGGVKADEAGNEGSKAVGENQEAGCTGEKDAEGNRQDERKD